VSDDNVVAMPGRRPLNEETDAEYLSGRYVAALRSRTLYEAADLAADLLDKPLDMTTIVHVAAIAALGAASAVASDQKGQALGLAKSPDARALVVWKFLEEYGGFDDGPKRILQFRKMLYPQFGPYFQKVIDRNTMNWLMDEAKSILESGREVAPAVRFHLEGIAAGVAPFGFSVEEG
jgi:hypothetical protein